jgi:four helix bundle protein
MQKYEAASKLSSIEFKRLTGVQKTTFIEMIAIISLNIAEGAGEYAVDEKARFYRMAKRSATECAGVLDVCQRLRLIEENRYMKGRELLISIVSMLIKMAQKQR